MFHPNYAILSIEAKMQNQTNKAAYNKRQINQNPINQTTATEKKERINYRIVYLIILPLLLVGIGVFYFLVVNHQKKQKNNNSPTPKPTAKSYQATEGASQKLSQEIIFPFLRNGSIYLYNNSKEKLLVSPSHKTSKNACYNIAYPFISPNKKYIAYIEQSGDKPGEHECWGIKGILKIVYLDSGKIKTTNYKTDYFQWNSFNQIIFKTEIKNDQERRIFTVFYNPANEKKVIFTTIMQKDKNTGTEKIISGEFPFDTNKLIKYQEKKYYLIDKRQNKEFFLFDKDEVKEFLTWSLGGRYAIFERSKKAPTALNAIELVVDTQNPNKKPREIVVGRGDAGGELTTGRKWYFEKAFVVDCRQKLYFIDGRKPLQLTNERGGGCHNAEGFVATSPDGNYAFLKLQDHFELHSKEGESQKIIEITKVKKGRNSPKNLIWLDNNQMLIFQSTYGKNNNYSEPPNIYLFDRKSNTIKLIVKHGYLVEKSQSL